MKKVMVVYCILIGTGMLGLWIMLLLSQQVPELHTEPNAIVLHIIAESITAIALIIAGVTLWKEKKYADRILLFALGMLGYTLINSSGYFIEHNDVVMLIMFSLFFILGITAFIIYNKNLN